MVSRTAEGKHTKRFIVEVFHTVFNTWKRSRNDVVSGFFPTRKEAQAAIDSGLYTGRTLKYLKYRVRQK
jgi:hypothetical protein